MDNKFKFKTRYVSIVQRSSSVVNSFTSSVELIQEVAYILKRDQEPILSTSVRALSTNFRVQDVMPVTSARLADISRRASVST